MDGALSLAFAALLLLSSVAYAGPADTRDSLDRLDELLQLLGFGISLDAKRDSNTFVTVPNRVIETKQSQQVDVAFGE